MDEVIYLSPNSDQDTKVANVMKIIEYIKSFEAKNGLSREDIEYKYTHGWCADLAQMVKIVYEIVLGQKIVERYFEASKGGMTASEHIYLEIMPDKAPHINMINQRKFIKYIDILGVHDYDEAISIVNSEYLATVDNSRNSIREHSQENQRVFNGLYEEMLRVFKKGGMIQGDSSLRPSTPLPDDDTAEM